MSTDFDAKGININKLECKHTQLSSLHMYFLRININKLECKLWSK